MTKDKDKLGSRQRVSLAEMEETIANLVERGFVADSGRRRNGCIVWELTPQGKMLAGKMLLEATPD
jgi:hypothetical protein